MKEQLEELIEKYKLSKTEVFNCLEELNKIDSSKLDYKENDILAESKIRHEEEYAWKGVFISELENLF